MDDARTRLYNTLMGQPSQINYGVAPQRRKYQDMGFFEKKARSIENALGTTGAAVASVFNDAAQNRKTESTRKDSRARMNDIAKKYGYNSYQDVWDAREAAEASGDKDTLDKIDNVINPELQGQAKENVEKTNKNAAEYKDYMKNNYVSQKINQDRGKFAGSAINTLSTAADITGLANGPISNAIQGGIEGLADELEENGLENFSWERAGQNALAGAASGAVVGGLNKGVNSYLGKRGGNLFKGNTRLTQGLNELGSKTALGRTGATLATGAARGALSGAVGGATGAGLSAAMNNQDVLASALEGAKRGAQQGAIVGGTMAGVNTTLNKIPGVGDALRQSNQVSDNWKNSGRTFNERLTNTLTSGDSGIGNWLQGKQSRALASAGQLGDTIRDYTDAGMGPRKAEAAAYEDLLKSYNEDRGLQGAMEDARAAGYPDDSNFQKAQRYVEGGSMAITPEDAFNDLKSVYGDSFKESTYKNKDGSWKYKNGEPYVWTIYKNKIAMNLSKAMDAADAGQLATAGQIGDTIRDYTDTGETTPNKYVSVDTLGKKTEYTPEEFARLLQEYDDTTSPKELSGNSSSEVSEVVGRAGDELLNIYKTMNGGVEADPYNRQSWEQFDNWLANQRTNIRNGRNIGQYENVEEFNPELAIALGNAKDLGEQNDLIFAARQKLVDDMRAKGYDTQQDFDFNPEYNFYKSLEMDNIAQQYGFKDFNDATNKYMAANNTNKLPVQDTVENWMRANNNRNQNFNSAQASTTGDVDFYKHNDLVQGAKNFVENYGLDWDTVQKAAYQDLIERVDPNRLSTVQFAEESAKSLANVLGIEPNTLKTFMDGAPNQTPDTLGGWVKKAGQRAVEDLNNSNLGNRIKNVDTESLPLDESIRRINNVRNGESDTETIGKLPLEYMNTNDTAQDINYVDRIVKHINDGGENHLISPAELAYSTNNYANSKIMEFMADSGKNHLDIVKPVADNNSVVIGLEKQPDGNLLVTNFKQKSDNNYVNNLQKNKNGTVLYDTTSSAFPAATDESAPLGVMGRSVDSIIPQNNQDVNGTQPYLAYGESELGNRTRRGMLADSLERFGNTLEGAQADVTRAATRKLGIGSTGQVIENVRKKTGLTNLETQAKLAKELTGGENSLMDNVQRRALSASEDGRPYSVDTSKISQEVESIVDKYADTNMFGSQTARNKFISNLRRDIASYDADVLTIANRMKANAADLRGKGIAGATPSDSAKAKIYTEIANKLDDLSYEAIPKQNVEDMFDATIAEMRGRAQQSAANGNQDVAKAYNTLANKLDAEPRTIGAFRSFKKDFVDVSKISDLTGQAENGAAAQMGRGFGGGIKRFAGTLLQRPVNATLAKIGGAVNSAADRMNGGFDTTTGADTGTTYEVVNPSMNIYNAIGRAQGNTQGEGARRANYLASTAQEGVTVPNSGAMTLEDLNYTQPATNGTALYDTLSGGTTEEETSNSYFPSTGDYWTDVIGVALTEAIDNNDYKAFSTLYEMYQDSLAQYNKSKQSSNQEKLSDTQRRAYAAENSLNELSGMSPDLGYSLSSIPVVGDIATLGGNTYQSAANSLATQIGYMLSGANIKEDEAARIGQSYVPQPFDSEATRQSKLQRARQIIDQYKNTYVPTGYTI